MSAFTNFLEDKVLNHVLRNVAYTQPTTVFLGLFTDAPGETGGGTEVPTTDTGYARQAATFGAPANGTITTSANIEFPIATTAWGTITHVALFDQSAAGNMLIYGALTVSKVVGAGDQFRITTGNLTITLD